MNVSLTIEGSSTFSATFGLGTLRTPGALLGRWRHCLGRGFERDRDALAIGLSRAAEVGRCAAVNAFRACYL